MLTDLSIIVVVQDPLHHTVRCLEALRQTVTPTTEIILMVQSSADATNSYWDFVAQQKPTHFRIARVSSALGWFGAANHGLRLASGERLVVLNSTVIVTPDWLDGLLECMQKAADDVPSVRRVGLVGPVTNAAFGPQGVANAPANNIESLAQHARQHRAARRGNWGATPFLASFCMMMHRDCFTQTGGFDEEFGSERIADQDLLLRAQENGWDAVIAGDVYVHVVDEDATGAGRVDTQSGRELFYSKWASRRRGKTKLVAVYRVKNEQETLPASLDATASFADAIVVLDDGSTDRTPEICRAHKGVTRYEYQTLPFDERRDRNRILEMAEELNPDWVISIDGDEIFEMERAKAVQLMQLADPTVKVVGFHWYTFWEPTHSYFREDGAFGRGTGYRMCKWERDRRIFHGTPEGLHCGNIPQYPDGSHRFTDIRVQHLGYDSEEKRQRKLLFYRAVDKDPQEVLVGSKDYSHLVSPTFVLRKYSPRYGVSLCIITKNEEERLHDFLAFFQAFVDEICIVDTGSTDRTLEIARRFTSKIAIFDHPELDLAAARNRSLAMARHPWILSLDPDEEVAYEDFTRLQRLMDDVEVDAYTFSVANYQKDQPPVMTLAVRLFRNDPRIRYSRPVHETVEQSLLANPRLVVTGSGLTIKHWGFLKADDQVEAKLQSYFERNKRYREQQPDDPMPWYNEALHLLNLGHEDEAIDYLNRAMELDPKFLSPKSQLALIYQERAIALWRNLGANTAPDHPVHEVARASFEALRGITPARPRVGLARGVGGNNGSGAGQ